MSLTRNFRRFITICILMLFQILFLENCKSKKHRTENVEAEYWENGNLKKIKHCFLLKGKKGFQIEFDSNGTINYFENTVGEQYLGYQFEFDSLGRLRYLMDTKRIQMKRDSTSNGKKIVVTNKEVPFGQITHFDTNGIVIKNVFGSEDY